MEEREKFNKIIINNYTFDHIIPLSLEIQNKTKEKQADGGQKQEIILLR